VCLYFKILENLLIGVIKMIHMITRLFNRLISNTCLDSDSVEF
jgi:hypothetical protein